MPGEGGVSRGKDITITTSLRYHDNLIVSHAMDNKPHVRFIIHGHAFHVRLGRHRTKRITMWYSSTLSSLHNLQPAAEITRGA